MCVCVCVHACVCVYVWCVCVCVCVCVCEGFVVVVLGGSVLTNIEPNVKVLIYG